MSPHVGPKPRTTYDAFLLRSAADPSGRWGPLGHWGPRDTAKALGKGIRIISHACGISSLCSDSRSCHRVLTTAPIRARRPRGRHLSLRPGVAEATARDRFSQCATARVRGSSLAPASSAATRRRACYMPSCCAASLTMGSRSGDAIDLAR